MQALTPKDTNNRVTMGRDDITDSPLSFEEQLAAMSGLDAEMFDTTMEGEPGPEIENSNPVWDRPNPPRLDPNKDSILFQQIEIDHYLGNPFPDMPGSQISPVPIMRMYGVTMEGNSVCCHIHGFTPYFFILMPQGFNQQSCKIFRDSLNKAVLADMRSNKENIEEAVLEVSIVKKQNMFGFRGNEDVPFILVKVALPRIIAACKRVLERGLVQPQTQESYQFFETNVDFDIRFMVDTGVVGCSWIELPPRKWKKRHPHGNWPLTSRCQIELDIAWNDFISHPPEGEWSKVAPFRILSFDIECSGRKGIFPEAMHDPVIQIANMCIKQGCPEPFIRNVFALNTCAPIVGSHVHCFQKEKELLKGWGEFVREADPDIITGYNICNFDIPYLIDRAKHLKVDCFSYLGRIKDYKSVVKNAVLQSKQMGRRESKNTHMPGRVIFDLLLVLVRDYKLRSYTLNSVSQHFLNQQKEDVHHSVISDLQNGDDQTRKRLAIYCLKDAYLPLRLIDKLMCVINYMEMARVTGVPLSCLLTRGQQIKVVSQLLRKAREKGFLMPTYQVQQDSEDQFEGATVIEPKKGYYKDPISTLDFSSLYPSIMMAHNLCYTTLLRPGMKDKLNLSSEDYVETPAQCLFVKKSVRKGLLPEILENLLEARKKAKKDLKNETDPLRRKVLDGRQLALKISANSVYGFTGAQVGKLPCLEISASVTAYGRSMIEQTKSEVESRFSIANGYEYDSVVIYGDTDSVMIKFGNPTLEECMKLGKEAAEYVTSKFVKPISLEFEKIYFPYLLISKKRYAGLYFTKTDTYDKMDCKGLETVRRDNAPLVANMITMCLQKILIERNPDAAVSYAKQVISDLLCNKIDISQLVITKELTKTDYAAKQAHVELANKMKSRDPGTAPKLGDRVPYVICSAARNTPAYMKAEDPIYVLENSVPIDFNYYLENQLAKPLVRIFEPILGSKAESILIRGDHTRTRSIITPKTGALNGFLKKLETCVGCKTVLKGAESGKALCSRCKQNEVFIYMTQLGKKRELEYQSNHLWNQCQRCQTSVHEEVICTSRDCPIFYMRKKIQMDAANQAKIIMRFVDS